jgi:UDP-N-acetylmuramate dehydrogenase
MKITENIPIAELTTMRLGGRARYVIEVGTPDDVPRAFDFARQHNLPIYVIGGGSNIIGRDDGYDGVIILNRIKSIKIVDQSDQQATIQAMTGEILDDLVQFAVSHGYSGIEAMTAIPGTVGGAIIQNSGAYGQQLSDTLTAVTAYDIHDSKVVNLDSQALELSYRRSIFNNGGRGRYFLISATVRLRSGQIEGQLFQSLQEYLDQNGIAERDPATIRQAVADIRAHKLPNPAVQPSAGSFFKNYLASKSEIEGLRAKFPDMPIHQSGNGWKISSGWLIEQAGLKGQILHGFRISDQAALVLINESAKSYTNLAAARAEIIATVRAKFGLTIQQEPEEIF